MSGGLSYHLDELRELEEKRKELRSESGILQGTGRRDWSSREDYEVWDELRKRGLRRVKDTKPAKPKPEAFMLTDQYPIQLMYLFRNNPGIVRQQWLSLPTANHKSVVRALLRYFWSPDEFAVAADLVVFLLSHSTKEIVSWTLRQLDSLRESSDSVEITRTIIDVQVRAQLLGVS